MTSSSPMHNERSGGNISLLQIAARAAGCLNNRKEGQKKKKKKEASHSWLASKTEQSRGAIHFQGPESGTWRLAKAGGRTTKGRRGTLVVRRVGVWVNAQPPPQRRGVKSHETNFPLQSPQFFIFIFSFLRL